MGLRPKPRLSVRLLRILLWSLAVLVCAGTGTAARQALQQRGGEYQQADVARGLSLYEEYCARCHGTSGDGVANVDLRRGRFRRASTDDGLREVIAKGIPGTPMPPHNFSEPELVGLIAYLRTMGALDAGSITKGDSARGRAIVEERSDCLSCHRVHGRGSRMAPDLSDVGARRSAGLLQQSLVEPSAAMQPRHRVVRAVTRDGRVISGRRLNEDTHTVQLIDQQEHLLSLDKADLREYTVLTTSPMPSYKDKLSAQELADVVAYLASLKGLP